MGDINVDVLLTALATRDVIKNGSKPDMFMNGAVSEAVIKWGYADLAWLLMMAIIQNLGNVSEHVLDCPGMRNHPDAFVRINWSRQLP